MVLITLSGLVHEDVDVRFTCLHRDAVPFGGLGARLAGQPPLRRVDDAPPRGQKAGVASR